MANHSTILRRRFVWGVLGIPIVVVAVAVLVLAFGQSRAQWALAGPTADLTGDWGYVYSVGAPGAPFVGACLTVLSQTAGSVTSTTDMGCESSGSPTATGGVVTATVTGTNVVGQVAFSGPSAGFTVNFTGTAAADGSSQSGTWVVKSAPTMFGSYSGLKLVKTNTSPVDETVTIPPSPSSGSGATVTFNGGVTAAGGTQVITGAPTGGVLPENFQLYPTGTIYNVVSTATPAGSINVCINYQDKNDDGDVDGTSPPIAETNLELWHDESGTFVNRTEPSKTDYVNNQICAVVSSLSEFALGVQGAPPPVGGISLDSDLRTLPLETAQSSGSNTGVLAAVLAAVTAGAVALGGAAWYARRRWLE